MLRATLRIHSACILFTFLLTSGCSGPAMDTRFEPNKSLFGTIREAEQITLYEGLPRAGLDLELFNQESQKPDNLEFQGFLFYGEPLVPRGDDQNKLQSVLGDEGLSGITQARRNVTAFIPTTWLNGR